MKADPAELERVYKDMVREWKVRSVLIYQEANAKAFQASLKAGKRFEALAKQAVADKKGEWTDKAEFLPRAKMLPQILAALSGVKPGQVSPSAKVDEGWAIMEVQDVRYPEDPAARAQAEKVVLSEAQKKALQDLLRGAGEEVRQGQQGAPAVGRLRRPATRARRPPEGPAGAGDLRRRREAHHGG